MIKLFIDVTSVSINFLMRFCKILDINSLVFGLQLLVTFNKVDMALH